MSKCKNCHYYLNNIETYPYCVKCACCKNKTTKHILQTHLDGSLPKYCQICDKSKWTFEFKRKTFLYLLKQKN